MSDDDAARTLPEHVERLGAARRLAQWHLGDADHADPIVAAYCNPEQAHEYLDREGADE